MPRFNSLIVTFWCHLHYFIISDHSISFLVIPSFHHSYLKLPCHSVIPLSFLFPHSIIPHSFIIPFSSFHNSINFWWAYVTPWLDLPHLTLLPAHQYRKQQPSRKCSRVGTGPSKIRVKSDPCSFHRQKSGLNLTPCIPPPKSIPLHSFTWP